jgi:cell envelope-related function transcriptional attenuator common domain
MSPQGDERPPKRPGGSEGGGKPDEPNQPGGSGAEGKPKSGKKPDYTVYGRGGRGGRGGKKRSAPPRKKPADKGEKPPYTVYKSRPSLRDRIRKPSLQSIRRESGGGGGIRGFFSRLTGGKRPWLRWILIFAVGWLLLSFITFAISAQIQKGKLPQSAKDALKGGPAVLAGQNILIIGGDRRGKTQHNASGSEGQGPPRADTIMVLHASLTSFRKLSIPRDSYAAIPDCGSQKINASLACNTQSTNGNPASTIKTVENFLGIDINHIVIVDFDGFAQFIDTLGGVTINVPDTNGRKNGAVVCGDVDGGKKQGGVSLKLPPGDITLQGDKALAYARIRHNNCDPAEDDRDRAARQQEVLNAIKGRLTSITRFPYNFIKGPFIGWDAPKAFISDMGGFTLPQVAISAILGGSGATNVLGGSGAHSQAGPGPGGSLEIPQSACDEAVKKLIGGDPPRRPACSP